MEEKHDLMHFTQGHQDLESRLADIAIVLGHLVAPSVVGQAQEGQDQADDGDEVAPHLLPE